MVNGLGHVGESKKQQMIDGKLEDLVSYRHHGMQFVKNVVNLVLKHQEISQVIMVKRLLCKNNDTYNGLERRGRSTVTLQESILK